MERALVIGRFQPFHKGHLAVIRYVERQGFEPLVAIGSAQAHHTYHNPFTADERKEMVQAALARLPDMSLPEAALACLPGPPAPSPPVPVFPLEDLFDPPRWAAMALERLPPFAVVFSNDPTTIEAFRGHDVEVRNIPEQQRSLWQGRVIREQMANGDPAWREAVPEVVVEILDRLDAPSRLARLKAENDGDVETPADGKANAKADTDNERKQES